MTAGALLDQQGTRRGASFSETFSRRAKCAARRGLCVCIQYGVCGRHAFVVRHPVACHSGRGLSLCLSRLHEGLYWCGQSCVGSTVVCVRHVCQRSSSDGDGRSVQTSACRTEAKQLTPLMPSLDRANRHPRDRFNVKKPRQLSQPCAGSGKGSGRLPVVVLVQFLFLLWLGRLARTLPWPLGEPATAAPRAQLNLFQPDGDIFITRRVKCTHARGCCCQPSTSSRTYFENMARHNAQRTEQSRPTSSPKCPCPPAALSTP